MNKKCEKLTKQKLALEKKLRELDVDYHERIDQLNLEIKVEKSDSSKLKIENEELLKQLQIEKEVNLRLLQENEESQKIIVSLQQDESL